MTVKELSASGFLEARPRLTPIFDYVSQEVNKPYKADWFFPYWSQLMDAGIAKAWETEGAVLGAVFYKDVYTGNEKASVMFFFALPEARGTGRPVKLLDTFEVFAGDRKKSIAAHMASHPERVRKLYSKRGYQLDEEIWSK
jgi:GNAT superfamily N-acetyltransferase